MKTFFDVRDGGKTVVQFSFTRHEGFRWGAELVIVYTLCSDGAAWKRVSAGLVCSHNVIFKSRSDAVATFEAISKYTPTEHGTSLPSDFIARSTTEYLKKLDFAAYQRSLLA